MASSATTSEQLSSCERELSEANWDMSDATNNGLILPSLSLQEVFNSHKAMQYSDPSFHDQCPSVLGLDIVELEELECSLPSFLCSNSQLAARSSTPVEDERSSSFFTLVKNILEGRTPDCNAVSFPLDDFLASCGAGKGLISSSCENVNDGKPVSPSNPSSVTMQCQHEESSSLSAVPHDYNKEGLISQSCSTASSNHEELVEDRCHEGGGFTAINYTGKHDCSDVHQKLSCAREADGTVSSFSQDSNPCSHQLASKLGAARRVCGDDAWLPGEDEAGLRFSSDEKGGMTPCKSIIVDHDQYSTEAYAASMEQLPKPSIIAANYDYFYNTSSAANCNSILENNGALEIGEKPMFQLPSAKELMYRAAALRPIEVSTEGSAALNKPKRRNVKISKDPQSVAARHRRERISEKIRILQRLVPGGTKLDTASMLDEAVQYLKFLKAQVHAMGSMGGLSCKVFPIITHTGPAKASIRPSSTSLNLSANYAHADGFPCSRVPSLGSTQLQDSSTSAHTMLPILYNVM